MLEKCKTKWTFLCPILLKVHLIETLFEFIFFAILFQFFSPSYFSSHISEYFVFFCFQLYFIFKLCRRGFFIGRRYRHINGQHSHHKRQVSVVLNAAQGHLGHVLSVRWLLLMSLTLTSFQWVMFSFAIYHIVLPHVRFSNFALPQSYLLFGRCIYFPIYLSSLLILPPQLPSFIMRTLFSSFHFQVPNLVWVSSNLRCKEFDCWETAHCTEETDKSWQVRTCVRVYTCALFSSTVLFSI